MTSSPDQPPPTRPLHSGYHDIQIENLGLPNLLAAEREKLAGEFGRARHGVLDLRQLRSLRIAEIVPQQIGVSGDHSEQIVEVVRDASRQAAHGALHLLRLAKLLLHALIIGDDAADSRQNLFRGDRIAEQVPIVRRPRFYV